MIEHFEKNVNGPSSEQNKLDIVKAMMDCLLAKTIPCVTDCVVAELEKLGPKYRVALRLTKDPRFQRVPCSHSGTYADDCLVQVIQCPRMQALQSPQSNCLDDGESKI